MLTPTEMVLLVVQIGFWIALLSYLSAKSRKLRLHDYQFRVTQLKDKWVCQVLAGSLSETSDLFRVYYETMDRSTFGLSESARDELAIAHEIHPWHEVWSAPPDVKGTVEEFFELMKEISLGETPWLTDLVRSVDFSKGRLQALDKGRRFSKYFSSARHVYDTYRFFDMHCKVARKGRLDTQNAGDAQRTGRHIPLHQN